MDIFQFYGRGKKGQYEIFGLVIIVLLVSIGMIYMISMGSKGHSDVKQSYVAHQIGANILNSILETKVVCTSSMKLTVTELLQDCAEMNRIDCDQTGLIGWKENVSMKSCEFANYTIAYLLNETLNKWGIKYDMTAVKEGYEDEGYINDMDDFKIEFNTPLKFNSYGNFMSGCKRRYKLSDYSDAPGISEKVFRMKGKLKEYPIPLYPGTLWVDMFICD